MRIADFHYGNANYDEAAFHYDQLIRDDHKSPFLRRAYMGSIESKINGYVGPEYDGTGLEEAREVARTGARAELRRRARHLLGLPRRPVHRPALSGDAQVLRSAAGDHRGRDPSVVHR